MSIISEDKTLNLSDQLRIIDSGGGGGGAIAVYFVNNFVSLFFVTEAILCNNPREAK